SLTVLVPYRSPAVFSLGWWSTPLPTRFRVSGRTHATDPQPPAQGRLRGSHPLRPPVPEAFGSSTVACEGAAAPSGPPVQPPTGSAGRLLSPVGFGLCPVRSPLLR